MNMKALTQEEQAWRENIIEAIVAGADMILICRHLDKCKIALEALRKEAAKSKAFSKRLGQAAGRMLALRNRLVSL